MAFDNYYPNRKDKRREYRGSRACDRTCRSHGCCGWCLGNRTAAERRRKEAADHSLADFVAAAKAETEP